MLAQLYSSSFNDDKKLLTFSDFVRDASHRAGFFAARTYRFNLRSAIQQCVHALGAPVSLEEIPSGFCGLLVGKNGRKGLYSSNSKFGLSTGLGNHFRCKKRLQVWFMCHL
jgi:hypothetical protein